MVKVELFPTRLGDNNISSVFIDKQCSIMLKIYGDEARSRAEWLISGKEAQALITSLQKALAEAKTIGLEVV